MSNELPNFIRKIGEYKDKDKENVLPGKNVAASFGPNSYSVLEEKTGEQNEEKEDKYNHLDNLNDAKQQVNSIKESLAQVHPDERLHRSTKGKNSKTNRPFKEWQN